MKTKIFSALTLFVLMIVGLFVLPTPGLCADEIIHEAESTVVYKDKDSVLLKDTLLELVKGDFTGTALEYEIVNDQYSGNGNKLGEYTFTVQAVSGTDTLRKTYKVKVIDDLEFDYYYNNKFYVSAGKNVTKEAFIKVLKTLEIIPNIDLSATIESEYFDYTDEVGTSTVTYKYIATSGDSGEGELSIEVLEESIFDLEIEKDFNLKEFYEENKNIVWIVTGMLTVVGLAVLYFRKK